MMSNDGTDGQSGKDSKGRFIAGNTYSQKTPYDVKLIRDSLKTNLYRAVNFLNFTHTQATEYVERIATEIQDRGYSDITMLEALVAEAVMKRKWDIILELLGMVGFGKTPAAQMNGNDDEQKTLVDDLTEEQKLFAIKAATNVMKT